MKNQPKPDLYADLLTSSRIQTSERFAKILARIQRHFVCFGAVLFHAKSFGIISAVLSELRSPCAAVVQETNTRFLTSAIVHVLFVCRFAEIRSTIIHPIAVEVIHHIVAREVAVN